MIQHPIWPILAVLALQLVGLGVALAKDGQSRDGKYSFGATFIITLIDVTFLFLGGFFDPILGGRR